MFADMSQSSAAGRQGDLPTGPIWIICIVTYVAIMLTAAFAQDFLQGPGRNWELGPLETGQNILLLAALIIMIQVTLRAEEKLLRGWMIFVSLGTLFLLGEEASWGQHYFNWETGGWFAQVNDQGETNFHNTPDGWLDQKPRAILQLGMILGAIAHPLVKKFRDGRGIFDNPWWLAPTFACMPPAVVSLLAGLPKAIDKLAILPFELQFTRVSEIEELFMYAFFVTYALSLRGRLAYRKTQAAVSS